MCRVLCKFGKGKNCPFAVLLLLVSNVTVFEEKLYSLSKEIDVWIYIQGVLGVWAIFRNRKAKVKSYKLNFLFCLFQVCSTDCFIILTRFLLFQLHEKCHFNSHEKYEFQ